MNKCALGAVVVKEFCKVCNWTYEAWVTRRHLFDENTEVQGIMGALSGEALARLSIIAHEYCLHQIAKLHDPAIQNGKINLTLRYIIEYGGWDQGTSDKLQVLYIKLDAFAQEIRAARNQIFSHNDLAVILAGVPLGAFEKDKDVAYFDCLQEFANIVHEASIGGPFPFNDLAREDAAVLAGTIAKAYST